MQEVRFSARLNLSLPKAYVTFYRGQGLEFLAFLGDKDFIYLIKGDNLTIKGCGHLCLCYPRTHCCGCEKKTLCNVCLARL